MRRPKRVSQSVIFYLFHFRVPKAKPFLRPLYYSKSKIINIQQCNCDNGREISAVYTHYIDLKKSNYEVKQLFFIIGGEVERGITFLFVTISFCDAYACI